jgi:hypothetical protein
MKMNNGMGKINKPKNENGFSLDSRSLAPAAPG